MFGDGARERDHVVVRLFEQLVRAFGLDRGATNGRYVFLWDHAPFGPRFAHRDLDREPQLHAVLVRPDAAHGRPCVTRDHAVSPPAATVTVAPLATVTASNPTSGVLPTLAKRFASSRAMS